MKVKLRHFFGIVLGLLIIVGNYILLLDTRWFKPVILIGVLVGAFQFFLDFFNENKRQKEIESKFLEFVRSLVETTRGGLPIPQAILKIRKEDFGALNPHVQKLANQIEWGIPSLEAFKNFSNDTENVVIKRSISIVIEAERSGGNIEDVLESVTDSILQVKKLRDERKSESFSQIVQGYIVFLVFIGVMLILQVKLLPLMGGLLSTFGSSTEVNSLDSVFLVLIVIQGLFAGLIIGKFSEGDFKMGVKHSLVLMVIAYLVITTVRGY
ncbi:hypothetical protein CL618_00770 [archaeon]|nr:hypothetical protein [archaeon]